MIRLKGCKRNLMKSKTLSEVDYKRNFQNAQLKGHIFLEKNFIFLLTFLILSFRIEFRTLKLKRAKQMKESVVHKIIDNSLLTKAASFQPNVQKILQKDREIKIHGVGEFNLVGDEILMVGGKTNGLNYVFRRGFYRKAWIFPIMVRR